MQAQTSGVSACAYWVHSAEQAHALSLMGLHAAQPLHLSQTGNQYKLMQ